MLYLICFFFNDAATTEIYTSDTLFPYTTLFRSHRIGLDHAAGGRLPAGATVGLTLAGPARAQRHPGSTGDRGSAGDTGCATVVDLDLGSDTGHRPGRRFCRCDVVYRTALTRRARGCAVIGHGLDQRQRGGASCR